MINSWDCRSVFCAITRDEVPAEFRTVYDRLKRASGPPSFGLFIPMVPNRSFLNTHWAPPRLILLFPDSMALLSLDTRSDLVITYELSRDEFLGFGLAEFLLERWLTIYHKDFPKGKKIHFPSTEKYYWEEMSRFLARWSRREEQDLVHLPHAGLPIQGLPVKFTDWLASHSEFGVANEYFFQPAMQPQGLHHESFPNLLFFISPHGLVALQEHFPYNPRKLGIEMTFLPRARVKSADWIEPANSKHAVIEISVQGALARTRMPWSVFAGLRPYALRWLRVINQAASPVMIREELEATELPGVGDLETESKTEASVVVDGYHVR